LRRGFCSCKGSSNEVAILHRRCEIEGFRAQIQISELPKKVQPPLQLLGSGKGSLYVTPKVKKTFLRLSKFLSKPISVKTHLPDAGTGRREITGAGTARSRRERVS
jgi:hypothetical protein